MICNSIRTSCLNTLSLNNARPIPGREVLRQHTSLSVRSKAANFYAARLMKAAGAVVFDYNGVIINDEHIVEKVTRTLLDQYGFSVTPEDYERIFLGRPSKDSFPAYCAEHHLELPKDIEEIVQDRAPIYTRLIAEEDPQKLFPEGAKELILLLSGRFNKRLAIASMSRLETIKPGLDQLGLFGMFQNYLITGKQIDQGRGKPCPDVYQKALLLYDLPPGCIKVAVEDTPAGVSAAKSAGMFCIAVLHTSQYGKLRAAGADDIVKNLFGLFQALK